MLLSLGLGTGEKVSIVSNGSSYSLSLDAGQTWSGLDSGNVSGNGLSALTITGSGIAAFIDHIAIGDSASTGGDAVAFLDSGASAYTNNFQVSLGHSSTGQATPGLSVSGSTSFSGTAGLSAAVSGDIVVNAGARITMGSGALTVYAGPANVQLTMNGMIRSAGGDISIGAAGAIAIGTGASIDSGSGTTSLAADVLADGSGDDGSGTLSVGAGASVGGKVINLRGADVAIDSTASVGRASSVSAQTLVPSSAGLRYPSGIAVDAVGNKYVSDSSTGRIMKITASGAVSTFASGLSAPMGLGFDTSGNLYVAGENNGRVYKVTPDGTVNTITEGNILYPYGLAVDSAGNIYVSGNTNGNIYKVTPAGVVTTFAAGVGAKFGLAFDTAGNLYASTWTAGTVKKITPAGVISTYASNVPGGLGLAFDAAGSLFVAAEGPLFKVTSAGVVSTVLSDQVDRIGIAFDSQGILYSADGFSFTVSKITLDVTPTDSVSIRSSLPGRPIALGAGAGSIAGLNLSNTELARIFTSPSGTVTIGDSNQTGDIVLSGATLATTPGAPTSIVQSGAGHIILDDSHGAALNGNGGSITLTAGSGGIVALNAADSTPEITTTGASVSLSTTGNIGAPGSPIQFASNTNTAQQVVSIANAQAAYLDGLGSLTIGSVSESSIPGIFSVTARGDLVVAPGAALSTSVSLSADTKANGSGDDGSGTLTIAAGASLGGQSISLRGADVAIAPTASVGTAYGQPQTFVPASVGLYNPTGVVMDSAGNLYVGASQMNRIVKVTPAGVATVLVSGVYSPRAMAIDALGNLYATSANGIYKVTPDGTATILNQTTLWDGQGVAVDSAGNVYVSRSDDARTIAKVTPAGVVSTYATGVPVSFGLALDAAGNLYTADRWADKIHKITPDGTVSTFASNLLYCTGLAFDAAGDLFAASYFGEIYMITPGGVVSTVASGLGSLSSLAFDTQGALYVADTSSNTVSKFLPGTTAVSIRSSLSGRPIALGAGAGAVVGINLTDVELARIVTAPGGTLTIGDAAQTGDIILSGATLATTPGSPTSLVQSGAGRIVLDDSHGAALNGNGGSITLTAGSGGIVALNAADSTAEIATIGAAVILSTTGPIGSPSNPIQFADNPDTAQQVVTIADSQASYLDGLGDLTIGSVTSTRAYATLAVTARGDLTVAPGAVVEAVGNGSSLAADTKADGSGDDGNGTLTIGAGARVVGWTIGLRGADIDIDGTATVGWAPVVRTFVPSGAGLSSPTGAAFDAAGNLYISNSSSGTISRVTPQGTVNTFVSASAGLSGPAGLAFDASGNLYVASQSNGKIFKVDPDGGYVPFVPSGVGSPCGLAFDAAGNLYVSDSVGGAIYKVTPQGVVSTLVAGGLSDPAGLAFDAGGNLYVASPSTSQIFKVAPDGTVSSFATTGLNAPSAIAFDAAGNLYATNSGDGTVSKVTPQGVVSTFLAAGLSTPMGLTFDAAGNLFVANAGSGSIVKLGVNSGATSDVTIRSSVPTRPISLGSGTAVAGINLSNTELARIVTTSDGTVIIGDAAQTGDITFRGATPVATAEASLSVVESTSGAGKVVLDTSDGIALDVHDGAVSLTPGQGGIVASASPTAAMLAAKSFTATGLTVNLGLAAEPSPGQVYTLVSDSGGGIVGHFANLADGQIITLTQTGLPCRFLVSYEGGADHHDLILTAATAPTITSADHATFQAGAAGSFTITTTGVPAPTVGTVSLLPTWLKFVDNGDGTATISGTPPASAAGDVSITIAASNGTKPDAFQLFTLTVNAGPTLTVGLADGDVVLTNTTLAAASASLYTTGDGKVFHVVSSEPVTITEGGAGGNFTIDNNGSTDVTVTLVAAVAPAHFRFLGSSQDDSLTLGSAANGFDLSVFGADCTFVMDTTTNPGGSDTMTFAGTATATGTGGFATTVDNQGHNSLTSIAITGSGRIVTGAGGSVQLLAGGASSQITLDGASATSLIDSPSVALAADSVRLANGTLSSQGLSLTTAALSLGDGNADTGSASLVLQADGQLVGHPDLDLQADAVLDLGGFDQAIGGLTMTGGEIDTGAGVLTLGGDVTTHAASTTATIRGNLDLGGADRTFNVAAGSASCDLSLLAGIAGTNAGLTIQGGGDVTLAGDNTYDGTTDIKAGTVTLASSTGLGSVAGGTTVEAGAQFVLKPTTGNLHVGAEGLTLLGGGQAAVSPLLNQAGDNTWAGRITLGSSADTIVDVSAGTSLTQTATIGGGADGLNLDVAGGGTLILNGSASNDYRGTTRVSGGTTLALNQAGVAIPGDLVIGQTGIAMVQERASGQIADTAKVTVLGGSTLDLNGQSDAIGSLDLSGATVTTGAGALTLGGDLTATSATVGVTATASSITGNLVLAKANPDHVLDVARGPAASDLTIGATITGTNLVKQGTGTLRLDGSAGANDLDSIRALDGLTELAMAGGYTAARELYVGDPTGTSGNSATVRFLASGQLDATHPLHVLQSGLLDLGGFDQAVSSLVFEGGEVDTGAGTLTLNGDVDMDANAVKGPAVIRGNLDLGGGTRTFAIDQALGDLTIDGVIRNGGVTLDAYTAGNAGGVLNFIGKSGNTYTGATTVRAGTLQLGHSGGSLTIAGPLVIGDGVGESASAVVRLTADDQLAPARSVTLDRDGLLDLNGHDQTVAGLNFTGGTVQTGEGTLTLSGNVAAHAGGGQAAIYGNLNLGDTSRTFAVEEGGPGTDLVLGATLDGSGVGLVKDGAGEMVLSGSALPGFSGTVAIHDGRLEFGSGYSNPVTVAAGGFVGGSPLSPYTALTAMGPVTVSGGGMFSPGGPEHTGILSSPSVDLTSAGTPRSVFQATLGGTTPGAGYDQLRSGLVTLDGATLSLLLGDSFVPSPGQTFALITGPTSDVGRFNGLPEGSQFSAGGVSFSISYRGGDSGHDVVLTALATPTVGLAIAPESATYGQQVMLTSQVSGGDVLPTGTVAFYDGDPDSGGVLIGNAPLVAGIAIYVTPVGSPLGGGVHHIQAKYLGDSTHAIATSAVFDYTIAQAATTTALVVGPDSAVYGQTVTLAAHVTGGAAAGNVPGGKVAFYDGKSLLGEAAVDADGNAYLSVSDLTPGAEGHTLSARYEGDSDYLGSQSAIVSRVIARADTTTRLVASVSPSAFGQDVTFTAFVAAVAPGAGTPAGMAQLMVDDSPLGNPFVLAGGQGSVTVAGFNGLIGSHKVAVIYLGGDDFNTSRSADSTQVVNKADVQLTLSLPDGPISYGRPFRITVTAAAVSPGAGVPDGGEVLLRFGGYSAKATLEGGKATFSNVPTPEPGSYALTVGYDSAADPHFRDGSLTATEAVARGDTTTTLGEGTMSSEYGSALTWTATVHANGAAGVSGGSVVFRDGDTILGTAPIVVGQAGAVATFSTAALGTGIHHVWASYSGDSEFLPSDAGPSEATVSPAGTVTTITSTLNPSLYGQGVVLVATVQAGGGIQPTSGWVQFWDGGTLIGTATVGTTSRAILSTPNLSMGSHSLTAVFLATADFRTSGSAPIVQEVSRTQASVQIGWEVARPVVPSSARAALAAARQPRNVVFTVLVHPAGASEYSISDGTVSIYRANGRLVGTVPLKDGRITLRRPLYQVWQKSFYAFYNGCSEVSRARSNTVRVSGVSTSSKALAAPGAAIPATASRVSGTVARLFQAAGRWVRR